MDSYGGWIGAPVDYLRFLLAIDGRRGGPLLDATMIAEMNTRFLRESMGSGDDEGTAQGAGYGLGMRITARKGGGVNLWHSGSLPGTSTLAVRTADGFTWVAAFNGRPQDRNAFRRDQDRGLWEARGKVKHWPEGDLFGRGPWKDDER
jgi:N-acyl-D-amino-acid deacylase